MVKKIIGSALILAIVLFNIFAEEKNIILEEGFESGNIPANWKKIDQDGDGEQWEIHPSSWSPAHTGNFSVASYSWFNGNILYPNNWLITPQLSLPNSNDIKLEYWIRPISQNYYQEHYEIKISTTSNNIPDFTEIFQETINYTDWQKKEINLSSYSGQNIYLAFVHANISNIFAIKMDDIKVSSSAGVGIQNTDTKLKASNFPNPFNPNTTINYDLDKSDYVVIEIYNILGQKIRTLFNGYQNSGKDKKIIWDGKNDNGNLMPSGIYFYKIKTSETTIMNKMVLVR